MRIALISDIHGNQIALEAVLADIKKAGVDQTICLGDIANIGPHPRQCLAIIQGLNCPVLQGNHELYLLGRFENDDWRTSPFWASMRWSQAQLSADQLTYIEHLPVRHEINGDGRAGATLVHGSPLSQYKGFLPHHNNSEIAERMDGLDDTTLFCGHTHVPLYRPWSNARLVNIGAVGMPLDGDPAAKYVIATRQKAHWRVEFRTITYDVGQLMVDFEAVKLQQVGGKITAVFRYQMLTGRPLATQYFQALERRAAAEGVTIRQAYEKTPAPPQVEHWLNGYQPAR